ncbi:MAG: hypothetical protein ACK4UJ_07730 [Leptonema sp. (in: bacteria)]
MMHINHYQLNKTHRYCIYIQPKLYAFLKQKSRGDISGYIETLYQNYKDRLIQNKKLDALQNAVSEYQPKTKEYKRIVIRAISTDLWKRLKELKAFSGYSISFILRIFIEWEMEKEESIIPLRASYNQGQNYTNFFLPINNYVHHEWWDGRSNEVYSIFWDFP